MNPQDPTNTPAMSEWWAQHDQFLQSAINLIKTVRELFEKYDQQSSEWNPERQRLAASALTSAINLIHKAGCPFVI